MVMIVMVVSSSCMNINRLVWIFMCSLCLVPPTHQDGQSCYGSSRNPNTCPSHHVIGSLTSKMQITTLPTLRWANPWNYDRYGNISLFKLFYRPYTHKHFPEVETNSLGLFFHMLHPPATLIVLWYLIGRYSMSRATEINISYQHAGHSCLH